jgi:hypothetical protein
MLQIINLKDLFVKQLKELIWYLKILKDQSIINVKLKKLMNAFSLLYIILYVSCMCTLLYSI